MPVRTGGSDDKESHLQCRIDRLAMRRLGFDSWVEIPGKWNAYPPRILA